MTSQHSKRALPFDKNGKPSKHNSLSTVRLMCTHNKAKPKARPNTRKPERIICASFDPNTGRLSTTILNGQSYLTKSEKLTPRGGDS